jgi:hypothetical protein
MLGDLSAGTSEEGDRWVADIVKAFLEFVSAESPVAARQVLVAYPQLTGEVAEQVVEAIDVEAPDQYREAALARIDRYRALLRRCREIGADAAFAELNGVPTALPDLDELVVQLELVSQPASEHEAARTLAAKQFIAHPGRRGILDPRQAALLDLAALRLVEEYDKAGSLADLNLATRAWGEAVTLVGPESPDRAGYLNNLATGLMDLYGHTHNSDALDAALQALVEALLTVPDGRPERVSLLNNMAISLATRYQRTKAVSDLDDALRSWDEALAITPPLSPERLGGLSNRANGLLQRYGHTGNVDDQEAALRDWKEVLSLTTLDDPDRWRYLASLSSGQFSRYERTRSGADLDEAIASMEQALAIIPPQGPGRSSLLQRRANYLSCRHERTGDVADIDAALICVGEAIGLTLREGSAQAELLTDRGKILSQRYERLGNLADLDEALISWSQALAATPTNDPELAGRLSNRSKAHGDHYERTGNVTDLEAALEDVAAAISISEPDSPILSMLLNNRCGHLSNLYKRSGDLADLDAALADMQASLLLTPLTSRERPSRLNNGATLLLLRYERSGDVAELDSALAGVEEGLRLAPPDGVERIGLLDNRASGLLDRYKRTGRLTVLDEALRSTDEALRLAPPEMLNRTILLSTRANLFSQRYQRSGDVADLDAALDDTESALLHTAVGNPRLPGMLCDRANRLLERNGRAGDPEVLGAAMASLETALALAPPGSPNRPAILNSRSAALSARYAGSGDMADLEASLADLDEALSLLAADSAVVPDVLHNQARRLVDRHARTGSAADLAAGVAAFRAACAAGLQARPETSLIAARYWSFWATQRQSWVEAAEAGSIGLDAADRLVRTQALRTDKEFRLGASQGVATAAAYAWAKLGDGRKAVIAAERGRAVLMTEALAVNATMARLAGTGHGDLREAYESAAARLRGDSLVSSSSELRSGNSAATLRYRAQLDLDAAVQAIRDLPGFGEFLMRPSDADIFDQVVAGASDGPFAYIMSGAFGGVMMIVRQDGTVGITELPELTESMLGDKVQAYIHGYDAFRSDHKALLPWLAVLDETTHWLWIAFGERLLKALGESGARTAMLVPLRLLGLLPLHAAWVEVPTAKTGRRYLSDDVLISYAPNAQSIMATRAAITGQVDSILAIDEPWPVAGSPIAGSASEVAAAVASFRNAAIVLRHHNATRDRVLESLAGQGVVHMSCHGISWPDRPLDSMLAMAFDEPITLADILASRLDGTRLVVLSACEKAFPGQELLDEVVSLPAGLLQAGAAAAIGSLWSVDSVATMVLLTRFYQLWRTDGLPLSEALREAQMWVRDLTRKDLTATFPGIDFTGHGDAGHRPYANPHWWAAFALTGS